MLLSFVILALVYAPIGPTFDTSALLAVLRPFTDITGSIGIVVAARFAMSFVTLPITFIAIAISKCKSAIFRCLALLPESNVEGAIGPDLDTKTFS
jgi:hypothetical protein